MEGGVGKHSKRQRLHKNPGMRVMRRALASAIYVDQYIKFSIIYSQSIPALLGRHWAIHVFPETASSQYVRHRNGLIEFPKLTLSPSAGSASERTRYSLCNNPVVSVNPLETAPEAALSSLRAVPLSDRPVIR